MPSTFFTVFATTLLLAGCATMSETKTSPKGWVDALTKTAVVEEGANALIPRKQLKIFRSKALSTNVADQPIARIIKLVADRVPGGLLITVTGVTTKAGSFNGQLTNLESADPSVLKYHFNVFHPPSTSPSTLAEHVVTVAKFFTEQDLMNISLIRIQSANNVLTARL